MAKKKNNTHSAFALEIYVEEMPYGVFPKFNELFLERKIFNKILDAYGISASPVDHYATPRRLIFYINQVAKRQNELVVTGPPQKIAYADGKPTRALESFLKKNSITIDQVRIDEETDKVYFVKKGDLTSKLFQQIFDELVQSLITCLPKTMKWDSSGKRFIRPIRHLFCIFDGKRVPLKWGSLISSDRVVIEKKLSPKIISPKSYLSFLSKQGIVYDAEKRKAKIRQDYIKFAKQLQASPEINSDLLNEVVYLSEKIYSFCGGFSEELLKLPKEVLVASMSKNQRIFTFENKKGMLLPYFFAVVNKKVKSKKMIQKNYETILNAKLKDALFFFTEDMKVPISDPSVEKALNDMTNIRNLGTMGAKHGRIKKTLSIFGETDFKLSTSEMCQAESAAHLLKADLTTQMVGEFPSLQGIMGKNYAEKQGHEKQIALAIYEHYLPRYADDELPESKIGAVLSILDKMDNIVGCFALGLEPKASADPLALRRQAIGVIRILNAFKWTVDLGKIGGQIYEIMNSEGYHVDNSRLTDMIDSFFKDRFINIIRGNYSADLIEAVCSSSAFNGYDAYKKLSELSRLRKSSKDFERARVIVERTHNILKAAKSDLKTNDIDPKLITETEERDLWASLNESREHISQLINEGKYSEATVSYANSFHDKVHAFFDKVMVNAKDERVRLNRLSLCSAINRIYLSGVADLSKVVVSGNSRENN